MKNPQLCDQTNNFSDCSQLSLSRFFSHNQKWCLNYMRFDDISLYTRNDISNDLSFQYKSIYVDEAYDIFSLIDRSKLILCCVTRQNMNIKQSLTKDYKSQINFEKIRLIDLVKLLIMNRKVIDSKLEQLYNSNSHFMKEVGSQIAELDELSNYCVDWQINEAEITKEFRLSDTVVDCIVHDCGSDLSELDKFIYNKFTDFDNKIHLTKNRQQSRPEKSRLERHCEQLLQSLSNDVCGALATIGFILDRLLRGHCSRMVDVHYFHLTSDEIKEYTVEISESQFHKIVGLKHSLLQIERRVAENILTLTEWQLCPNKGSNVGVVSDCYGHALSPIRKCSGKSVNPSRLHKKTLFMASTPAPNFSTGRQPIRSPVVQEQRELFGNLREKSLSSLDSGYLLTPDIDPSLEDSGDDFDIIPFSDDEYEKINDEDTGSVFLQEPLNCQLSNKNSDNEIIAPDIIVIEPNPVDPCQCEVTLNLIQLCNQNKFCDINRTNKCLFVEQNVFANRAPVDRINKVMNWYHLFSSNLGHISELKLSSNDKEVLRSQIPVLLIEENLELNFIIALRMTVVRAQQNPFEDIKTILKYMEDLLISFNETSPTSYVRSCKSSSGVDNQYNNSACTPYIIHKSNMFKSCEQNTNNNADSKDDDSNELSVTQNYPISNDDSLYLDAELRIAFRNILSDSTSAEHNIDNSEGSSAGQFNDPKFSLYRDITVNVNESTLEASQNDWNEPISIETDSSLRNCVRTNTEIRLIEDIELVVKLSELHIRSEFQAEEYYKETMTSDQNRIVGNSKNLTSLLENSVNNNNNFNNGMGSGDDIDLNQSSSISPSVSKSHIFIQTDDKAVPTVPTHINDSTTADDTNGNATYNESVVEYSSDLSRKHNNATESHQFVPRIKKTGQEDLSRNWSDRISLSIKLTKKLLDISDHQLNFISSLFHKNSSSIKSTIMRNKSFSISSLRERLNVTIKILSNLKHAIKNTCFSELENEAKNLLTFWRAVDGECHRLLRCTSLVHHIMNDTRRSYIDLVSLIAIMYSIMYTVDLSKDESYIMKTNIETLMTYKQRILDWLGEVDLCISVINKKRMTKKRFRFYDEIHDYLEENLSTISELADRIKNGCQQTVNAVNDVVTYCANLPNNSISEIGKILTTNCVLDNEYLLSSGTNDEQMNENLFRAIIDLEKTVNNSADHLQDLLQQSKDILKIINRENSDLVGPEEFTIDFFQQSSECSANQTNTSLKETISESATLNISNKISKIAACAATNALLLFVQKCGFEFSMEKDTEFQMSSWTSTSEDDDIGNEVSGRIIEEISAMMTSSIAQNVLQLRNNRSLVASEIVLRDICREISDRTLQFIVEHIAVDREQVVELFLTDTSTDITNYLCEELGCLMMNNSLEELQFIGLKPNNHICTSTCQTKFERKLFNNLIEKSKGILLHMGHSSTSIKPFNLNFKSKDQEADSVKVVAIFPLDYNATVPINSSKQTYDSDQVCQSSTKLLDSKSISTTNQYRPEVKVQPEISPQNHPRQAINRISKLVAQFSQNLKDTSCTNKSPRMKLILERMSLNLLNIRSIQLVEEIANEAMKDAQFNYITPQSLEIFRSDRCSPVLVHIQKSIISGIIPRNPVGTSSNQIQSSEMLSFSDTKRISQRNIFPISVHSSADRFTASSNFSSVTKINENISRKIPPENMDCVLSVLKSPDGVGETNSDSSLRATALCDPEENEKCRDTDSQLRSDNVYFSVSIVEDNINLSDRTSFTVKPKQSASISMDFINFSGNLVTDYEGESIVETSLQSSFDERGEGNLAFGSTISGKKVTNLMGIKDGKCEASRLTVPLETVPEVNINDIATGSAVEVSGVDSDFEIVLNVTDVNIFEGRISRDPIDLRERFETQSKIVQSQNNNFFPNSSQFPLKSDFSDSRFTSRSRRGPSKMWLFVIIGLLLVLVLSFGGEPLCQFCNYLRLSQSLYPKVTSNGVPF